MSAEAIAIVGVGVALLAVLVPLILAQGRRLEALVADVAEVRRDLHALAERVARIEGALTGLWRPPANGNPAPAPSSTPDTAPWAARHRSAAPLGAVALRSRVAAIRTAGDGPRTPPPRQPHASIG